MNEVSPTHIAVHQKSRTLEIHFSDGCKFNLPCEYLRVFSPSAEVRVASNRGQPVRGKQEVNINNVEPMGSYAIRILFDDGHDTGIYSWSTLKQLGNNFESNWQQYQKKLVQAERDTPAEKKITVLFFMGLADAMGTEKLELDLTDDINSVEDVLEVLRQKGEEWGQLPGPEHLTITVNKQFSDKNQKLFNGDEIALVPKG